MRHRRRPQEGSTLVRRVVAFAIVAFVVTYFHGLLVFLGSGVGSSYPPTARCKMRLGQIYHGVRMYLTNFDAYLPLAYHRSAQHVSDLSNVSFHRFSILEQLQSSFRHVVVADTSDPVYGTPENEVAWKFSEARRFFEDPAEGRHRQYFSPSVIYRGHTRGTPPNVTLDFNNAAPYGEHAQYSELLQGVPSAQRPLMTAVNASFPPDEADGGASGHDADSSDGWSMASHSGATNENGRVFVGVGQSLRTPSNCNTSRIDFRHGGRCNMLYLNGSIMTIGRDDKAWLRRIHDRWNQVVPTAGD